MDLRQLEILRAVAQTGSFTSAGQQLHLSQSAVSRQILLLEEELKEQLFLRLGRKIRITPAGTTLLGLSQRDVRGSRTDPREHPRHPAARQRHGPPRRRHDRLPLRLSAAAQGLPQGASGRRSEADAGRDAAAIRQLRTGGADLGLLTLPVDDPNLVSVPVMREELLLVTAPTHPLARKKQITPQDLIGQPFVLFEAGSNSRKAIEEFFVSRADLAESRHRDRERRDHQGAGDDRDGDHDHPVSGRGARGARRASSSAPASPASSWCGRRAGCTCG